MQRAMPLYSMASFATFVTSIPIPATGVVTSAMMVIGAIVIPVLDKLDTALTPYWPLHLMGPLILMRSNAKCYHWKYDFHVVSVGEIFHSMSSMSIALLATMETMMSAWLATKIWS